MSFPYGVLNYGADPTGVKECSAAFIACAAANNGNVLVPGGTYKFSAASLTGANLRIIGSGASQTVISLGAGAYFIDDNQEWNSLYLSGLSFNGGAGAVRNRYAGTNVVAFMVVEDCNFYSYTGAAISNNFSDGPYWKINRCLFRGANYTTCIGVALDGFTDSSSITDCAFLANRVHVKLGSGGVNCHISACEFLRFGPTAGAPRVDVWCVPVPNWSPNDGNGFVVRDCKFGNENLDAADWRILYADNNGIGAYWGDQMPALGTASSGWIYGHTVTNVSQVSDGVSTMPLVYSMTPNLQACLYGPITQSGTSFAPILTFYDATDFQPSINVVGPLLNGAVNTANPPSLVTTQSGNLTGQPIAL